MISQKALEMLRSQRSLFPELSDSVDTITLQYSEKMWHQISDNLVAYFKSPAFDRTENQHLLELYNEMVKPLWNKLNPLKYAQITVLASRQVPDVEGAIDFLQDARQRLDSKQDAQFLCRIGQAEKRLNLGQHHDCLQILTEVREATEPLADVDPKVQASLADVFSQYYRRRDDQENYYRSGLQFLAYTPDTELTQEEKKQWSIKLGMAVLLGKRIFNITELLDKQILKSLLGSDFEWLYDLLQSLGRGQIQQFEHSTKKHSEFIARFPAILREMTYLRQKVKIIAFLEMVFLCGKDERDIQFAKIAETCFLEPNEVELLVMKAMSLELVRGTIDEVSASVQVDWILPRYLNRDHLQVLTQRMREWESKMEGVIGLLEDSADQLLQQ